jgi:nitroimidazol reductase NimA-like FMN-containing flavoprotein (pyridoxamine 5'-phosphate oxidase superfamily)
MTTNAILETLSQPECAALLAGGSVGRLAIVVDDHPHIVPVNYAAEGTTIVFRTAADTILTEASLRRVAFEVDAIDEDRRAGWSVCVHGDGAEITHGVDAESRHLRELFLDTWAPEGRDRWFKVVASTVTGRYLVPGARRFDR